MKHHPKTQIPLWPMLLLLLIGCFSVQAENQMRIYKMQYLTAEQVLPAIKPHLATETKITAKDYHLFIQASDQEFAKIKDMLAMLDKKPNNLLVEVRVLNRKLDNWEQKGAELKASGSSVSAEVSRYKTRSNSEIDNTFRLKTLEGYQGFISTGEAFPTNQRVKHYDSFIPQTQYKEAKSGFYVTVNKTPQQGYRVAISTQQQNRSANNRQTIQQSQATNIFNAPAGEWILIAASTEDQSSDSTQSYRTESQQNQKRWFYLRVIEQLN